MSRQYPNLIVLFAATMVFSLQVGFAIGATESFVIDSSRSEFGYTNSPWIDSLCNSSCEFDLSGSFVGEKGGQTFLISDPRLTIDGHDATSELQVIVNQKFPKTAGMFPGDPLAGGGGPGGPAAFFSEDELRLVASHDGRFADGEAYWFNVVAFATNELDCDGNGIVDFEDVACLVDANKVLTVLDASDTKSGDTNGNGSVGFEDFLVVSKNFGNNGGYLDGDLDLNGTVGFGDFLLLSSNFESAAGTSMLAAVPEPNSGVMLSAGFLILLSLGGPHRDSRRTRSCH